MRVPVYSLLPTATTPIRALSPHSNRVEAYHNGGSWDRSVRHFFRGNVYGIATETTATFNGITGFYAVGGSFPGGEKFSNPFGRSRFNYLCRTLDGRKLE